MGFTYGIIFGWMDVEDSEVYKIEIFLLKEESYCWPIGILIGILGGTCNEILRSIGDPSCG